MHTVFMHRTRMVHHLILSNACLDMWYARVLYNLLEFMLCHSCKQLLHSRVEEDISQPSLEHG